MSSAAHLAYELVRAERGLELCVCLVEGKKRQRVAMSMPALRKKLGAERLTVSREDRVIDELLRGRRRGPILRPLMPPLLKLLRQVEDVSLDGNPVTIGDPAHISTVRVEYQRGGGFRVFTAPSSAVKEVFANGAAICGAELIAVKEANLSPNDLSVLAQGRVYPPSEVHALVTQVLPKLRARLPVEVRTKRLPKPVAMTPEVLFSAEREGNELVVTPQLVYGNPPCARLEGGQLVYLGGALPVRDEDAERRMTARLRSDLRMQIGLAARATGEEAVALAKQVRAFGGAVEGDGIEDSFVASALTPELDLEGARAGLTFRSSYRGRVVSASAEAVVQAWERGQQWVALDQGGWAELPEDFLTEHGHLVADLLAATEGAERLPPSAGADMARLYEALEHPAPPDFQTLRQLAEGFEGIPPSELPQDFQGTLRGYQRQGLDWLAFLGGSDLGGLLADDMGLGKTVQAICALRSPALVVCPSSVLHAWQDEIRRFRPDLSVVRYHGLARNLSEDVDVTLTTYAILRRDTEQLAARGWDTIVLDEAQYIKNPDSQVARAAYELQARFRLALTGTPIENRLEDLWSLMHFLNPGLLGGLRDFRERYVRRMAEGDTEIAERLRRRVRPFVLRRMKSEVASELPPRTDVVLHCTLDREERAAYDAVRAATREEIVRELAAGKSVLAALEALLRLRQACCHTALLPGQSAKTSSKIQLLMETLEEAMSEGHRSLVFSQWTSLLDLVEPHLKAQSVPFLRLDGTTRDRATVVRTFQSDEGPPVMLLSLKAGGTGLTLTRADHVFLLDPWWNPAVEDQAADRIHRIGQEHPVLVHRLIAEDTVEEQLLALQARKRTLSESALGTGASQPSSAAGLTREDLLELLS